MKHLDSSVQKSSSFWIFHLVLCFKVLKSDTSWPISEEIKYFVDTKYVFPRLAQKLPCSSSSSFLYCFFFVSESPGNRKIPRVLQSLCCWHTRLLDCSAFQDPIENCLFSEHLVDALQSTSWLLTPLSHSKLPLSGLFFAAVTTLKGSCPNDRFSVLSPHCFAWSSVPAGLPLKRVPSPLGSLSLPTTEAGKYLYYVQQSVGNKGKKPVTSGHKGQSDLPKTTSLDGIPIPSWMWWFRKWSR